MQEVELWAGSSTNAYSITLGFGKHEKYHVKRKISTDIQKWIQTMISGRTIYTLPSPLT